MGKVFSLGSSRADIKSRKIFVKRDILVYVLLAVFLLSLFISLILYNVKNAKGFRVEMDGQTLITHEYGKEFDIKKDYQTNVEIISEGANHIITITFGENINVLFVDEAEKSVKMKESNCPSQNCVHMQAIKNTGAIYCAPRELKITPLFDNEINETPSIGIGGASK